MTKENSLVRQAFNRSGWIYGSHDRMFLKVALKEHPFLGVKVTGFDGIIGNKWYQTRQGVRLDAVCDVADSEGLIVMARQVNGTCDVFVGDRLDLGFPSGENGYFNVGVDVSLSYPDRKAISDRIARTGLKIQPAGVLVRYVGAMLD